MGMGEQPCVFLPDRHFQYSKVLFYGRELDLLLMNVLAYSLFDLWFGSTATSVLLTFLLDFAFGFLRRRLGMANIANKTLIGPSPLSPSPSPPPSSSLLSSLLFSSPPLLSLQTRDSSYRARPRPDARGGGLVARRLFRCSPCLT
jgi:hypothetical protein